MTPARLSMIVATATFVSGLIAFELGWIAADLLASAVAGVGCAFVVGRVLRPVRELATTVQRTQVQLTRTLAQIERDRSDMAALIHHMADGVLVLDRDDRVELANPAASRLLRRSLLQGKPLVTAVRDPDVLQLVRAAHDGSPIRHSVELRDPDGHRCWLQVVAMQLPTDRRILVLLQDVTELRRGEAVRRDFVANVSHELKTPVASLKALVETLESGALTDPDSGPNFLNRMHVEVDGLAQLVSELLELARMEAGRLDLEIVPCRVDELVNEAVDRIRPYAMRVGLDVRVSDMSPELVVSADRRHIGQVLTNLLSNAVKFTPSGGWIELGARSEGEGAEIWVRDSGVGISRQDLVRVFERFFKTDPSRTGTGTGLGLAICKHVVQAHSGSIVAESDGPGRGATFRFTLPVSTEPAAFTRSSTRVNTQPVRADLSSEGATRRQSNVRRQPAASGDHRG